MFISPPMRKIEALQFILAHAILMLNILKINDLIVKNNALKINRFWQ